MMRVILSIFSLLIACFGIAQAPNAQFVASPLSVCVGQPISFTNQSTAGGSPITTYTWNFGNGETSSLQNTNFVYTTPGVYTITLAVQAANGQADAEVKTNYITVNPSPTASFTTSGNGCTVPFGVNFTNTSSSAPGITYAWNFGNGQTSNLQTPTTVTYSNAGTFNVALTVTDANSGCTASSNQSIVVSNFTAGINAPTSVCEGQAVQFLNSSTVGANSFAWNSGGAGTSTAQNPTFTYNTPGNYTVTLTAQNTTSGCSASTVHQITVLPAPTPSFTATPTSGCSPLVVNFTNTSTGSGTFVWNFGDGATFTGQTPTGHTYSGNGSYSVELVMTGTNGCSDSVTISNLITLSDPVAQFTSLPTSGCAPLSVQFTDASISPNPASNPITSWLWNFGDGTTFNGQNPPAHAYAVGVYDVSLTITTSSGCAATVTLPQHVQVGFIDQINFTVEPTIQCAKADVDFTNTTVILAPHTPNEVTYFWDFGDDQTSTEPNPTHSYESDTGYYEVMLIVDFRGCKDTLIIEDAIYIKAPISEFTPATSLFCNPASFPVNATVNDQAIIGELSDDVKMIWKWGDGTQTVLEDVDLDDANQGTTSHNYTTYGSFTVEQVIYNYTTGCSDSTTAVIHVSQTIANFSVANDSICKNSVLGLNGSASTSTHPINSWSYAMGNGQTASGQTTGFTYTQAGTYTITMTATNNVGCSDTEIFTPIRVLELPLAQFDADDLAGCSPFLVNFTNTSTLQGNGVGLNSFLWSFSDNNSQQTTTNVNTGVNHTFLNAGNFLVTLVATDLFGCVSAPATKTISITKPIANFTVDNVVCDMEAFTTVNASTGFNPIAYQWIVDGVNNATTAELAYFFDETPSATTDHVTHTVGLIVTDGNGCTDTITQPIVVSLPVAGINFALDGAAINETGQYTCPPVFGEFEDATNSYGDVVSWQWNFGDGANFSPAENPSNIYVFPGTYTTTLSIIDEYGCSSDTALVNFLTIYGPEGTPSWTQSISNCGQNIAFSLIDTSNVVSIVWNTDDGNTVNDSTSFNYSYSSFDAFVPTVTLTDATGCIVIYPMDTIFVLSNGLDAFFEASSTSVKLGNPVIFDDQSTFTNSPIVNWTWDFGDGTTLNNGTSIDVMNSYFTSGFNTVTLTVTDAAGCKDQYKVVIFIDADFDMPNVFTPNGDGANDVFAMYNAIFDSFEILIQNRWGNVVTDQKNLTGINMWDGTDNGNEKCHDGVYFYQLTGTLNDGVTVLKKAGYVTLIGSK